MNEHATDRFGQWATRVVATTLIDFVLAAAVSILVLRLLGPEDAGRYAVWIVIPETLARFGVLGVPAANTYHVAQQVEKLPGLIGNSLLMAGVLSLVVALALAGYQELGGAVGDEGGVSGAVLAVLLLAFPGLMVAEMFRQLMLGLGLIGSYNLQSVLANFLRVIGVLVLLVLLDGGLAGALVAWSFGVIVAAVVGVLVVLRQSGWRCHVDRALLRRTLGFSARSYVASTTTFLNLRLDVYMLTALTAFDQVGFYKAATSLTDRLWSLTGSVGTVLFARIAGTREERDRRLTTVVARLTLLFTLALSLLLLAVSPWLVTLLYSATYAPAVVPLALLLPGVVAFALSQVLTSDIAGRGHPGYNAGASIAALVTNVVLNLLLVPPYGIAGAALATSLSFVLRALLTLAVYARLASARLRDVLIVKGNDWSLVKDSLMRFLPAGSSRTRH